MSRHRPGPGSLPQRSAGEIAADDLRRAIRHLRRLCPALADLGSATPEEVSRLVAAIAGKVSRLARLLRPADGLASGDTRRTRGPRVR
jgi:hypothetical protein